MTMTKHKSCVYCVLRIVYFGKAGVEHKTEHTESSHEEGLCVYGD